MGWFIGSWTFSLFFLKERGRHTAVSQARSIIKKKHANLDAWTRTIYRGIVTGLLYLFRLTGGVPEPLQLSTIATPTIAPEELL